jgi:ubiquinone/menaquinone biosynthesis C-methylase UbiE
MEKKCNDLLKLIKTSIKYLRISRFYDFYEYPIERFLFKKLRTEVISFAKKKTLEVGVGTGKNLPYYKSEIELTAIDFSSGMLGIAQHKYGKTKLKKLTFLEMDVQNLSFKDNTFDTIISTFVFCTVPDPISGLKELRHVLKPSGKAVFLEHMKSNSKFINIPLFFMDLFTRIILGTSMLRKTQENIEFAGFTIELVNNKAFDILRMIIARK